jgi:hypothetical protein
LPAPFSATDLEAVGRPRDIDGYRQVRCHEIPCSLSAIWGNGFRQELSGRRSLYRLLAIKRYIGHFAAETLTVTEWTDPVNHSHEPSRVVEDLGLGGDYPVGDGPGGEECLEGVCIERPGVEVALPAVALVPLQLGVLGRLLYPLRQGLEP